MGLHREAKRLRELGVRGYARRLLRNRLIALGNRAAPARYRCPCCEWRGARFFDYFGKGYSIANTVCPHCGSQPRHRGLVALLTRELAALPPGSRMLHLAPEPALAPALARHPDLICIGADLRMRGVNVRADAMRMPFRSNAFALVIASHLLEHLPDDRAALAEMERVMAPGARALILVPAWNAWRSRPTLEYNAPNPQMDNHWRNYGFDLAGRIEGAGLQCSPLDFKELVAALDFDSCGLRSGPVFLAGKRAH